MSKAVAGCLAAAVLLAACGAPSVQRTRIPPLPGTNATFAWAAQSGEMATVIIGNPFDVPQERTNDAVLAAMAGSYAGPDVRFTTDPAPNAPAGFEVVVLLDGPPAMRYDILCKNRSAAAPQPRQGFNTVVVSFCAGDSTLSSAAGSVARVAAPEDSAYRALISSAMIELIPRRQKEERGLRQ